MGVIKWLCLDHQLVPARVSPVSQGDLGGTGLSDNSVLLYPVAEGVR